jgi:glutamine amidotransferase
VTLPRVAVLDYGIGNLHSVVKALRSEGADVSVCSDPRDLARTDRLVVPGVGAFADGMKGLDARGLVEPLRSYAAAGRPLLGICLGMQLLFTESEEFGFHPGLCLIPGRVVEIARRPGFKVPQIGWNRLFPTAGTDWSGTLLELVEPGVMMYFVHSFAAVPDCDEDRLADSLYAGQRISAAVHRENIWGCQFHPEKSGPAGLTVLSRFLRA